MFQTSVMHVMDLYHALLYTYYMHVIDLSCTLYRPYVMHIFDLCLLISDLHHALNSSITCSFRPITHARYGPMSIFAFMCKPSNNFLALLHTVNTITFAFCCVLGPLIFFLFCKRIQKN